MTTQQFNQSINQLTFNPIDYVVFVAMLCVSAGIGIYFGYFAKGENTTEEYLMGGKRMKTVPIAISLVASQLSGVSIMTIPAEMYAFGIHWFFHVVAMTVVIPILNWIILPVFYNNNVTNCYEYLEARFNRQTRELQTFGFMITIFLMLPVFIFIPSLAFSQVTGFNVHLINVVVCSICVFYTMIGGVKAVVWTDVVQATIMILSIILVCTLGAFKVGGFLEVLRIAENGGRLHVDFTLDATTRSTFWNVFISAIILWTSYVGLNQSCVQRIVSLPSLGHARRSLTLFGLGFAIIMFFSCFTGLVIYALYHKCDPLLVGAVEKPDKLMPYFVQDIVGHLSGMPGVFISCVFSAALSTMSANLNSLAGIVYMDYIKPRIQHTESRSNLIMKTFVFITGIYCIIGGVIVSNFSSILQIVYTISGIFFGSVFGVFLLGMLIPRAHGKAAFYSVITSVVAMLVLVMGAQGHVHYQMLPRSTEGCQNFTSSPPTQATLFSENFNIFEISFNWYTIIGFIITWSVGIPLSFLLKPTKNDKFDAKLLSPIVRSFAKYELTQTEELPQLTSKAMEIK